jgi:hypothetical protein
MPKQYPKSISSLGLVAVGSVILHILSSLFPSAQAGENAKKKERATRRRSLLAVGPSRASKQGFICIRMLFLKPFEPICDLVDAIGLDYLSGT